MLNGPVGRPGDQDANVDHMVQKMADVLQNQFVLKPKMHGQVYTPLFPEWYHRVALPPRVKPPADFTKFSGQDDTSTVEHIVRYLMHLGEVSADDKLGLYMVCFFACSINLFLEGFRTEVPCSLLHWQ
jgi:hypothetical protein